MSQNGSFLLQIALVVYFVTATRKGTQAQGQWQSTESAASCKGGVLCIPEDSEDLQWPPQDKPWQRQQQVSLGPWFSSRMLCCHTGLTCSLPKNKYKRSGFIQGIGLGTQHPMGVRSRLQKERCSYLQGPASPSHPGVSMADPHTSILPCTQSEPRGPLCLQEEVHSTTTSSVSIAPTGQSE